MIESQDPYEKWIESRRNVAVPSGFADGVMDAIDQRSPSRPQRLTHSARTGLSARVAISLLALAACLFRMLHAVAVFMVS